MSKRRPVKKTRLTTAIVAVVVLLLACVAGPPLWRRWRTKSDVDQLVIALKSYALEFGKPPGGSAAEICAALRGTNPRREAVVENYRVNADGVFLDPYDSPYQINAANLRVYSFGPNKKDEGGQGDDIVSWR